MKYFRTLRNLLGICFLAPALAQAFGEISIQNIGFEEFPPFKYKVSGTVKNETGETREVALRAQVVFYDEAAPKGDLPVRVLSKDRTIVLRASETRNIEVFLFKEGRMPDTRLRAQPQIRIHYQRLWLNRYEDIRKSKS